MKNLIFIAAIVFLFVSLSFGKQDTVRVPLGGPDSTNLNHRSSKSDVDNSGEADPTVERDSVINLGKMPPVQKRGLINNIDTAVPRWRQAPTGER